MPSMLSYPRRPPSGHITCYLNRTYHVLTTPNKSNLILSEGKVILILSRGAVLARYIEGLEYSRPLPFPRADISARSPHFTSCLQDTISAPEHFYDRGLICRRTSWP